MTLSSRLIIRRVGPVILGALAWIALGAGASFFVEISASRIEAVSRINHMWKPNTLMKHTEFIADNPDFPHAYFKQTNSQGWLEDYDVVKEKPADTRRIFYCGDSFTEGTAPKDSTVPEIVERELNRRSDGARVRYEVINTGTSSYSPMIVYPLVRYVLADYHPDVIVFNVDMTDDYDDWKYGKTAILDTNGDVWAVPPRDIYNSFFFDGKEGTIRSNWKTHAHLFLLRNSYIYNLIAARAVSPREKAPVEEESSAQSDSEMYNRWSWVKHDRDSKTEANVARTLDQIRRIVEYCRSQGIRIVVTGVPHYQQFARSAGDTPQWSAKAHEEIAATVRNAGGEYFSSHEAMRSTIEGTEQTRYYYKGDMHFNPRGYQAWAEAHVRYFSRNGAPFR